MTTEHVETLAGTPYPVRILPLGPPMGNRYKATNMLHLQCQGYSDPRWMTLAQAQRLGGTTIPGSRATRVVHWQFTEEDQAPMEGLGKATR